MIDSNSKYSPFNIQWLDSSYQQTCLPDSPWQKILDDLEPTLANRIRQQFNNPQRRQILIELLGTQFQRKLLRSELDTPHILNPPYMLEEDRHKLENEAKSWLQMQTIQAAIETRAAITEDETTIQLSNDMKDFLEYSYGIVYKSFERYFYKIERKEAIKQEEQNIEGIKKKRFHNQLNNRSQFRSIIQDLRTNSKKLPMINESSSTSHSMTSQYSDLIANSIVAVLKHDYRRINLIKERLFGQQLPQTLRQFIWTECLLRFEKKPFDYDLTFIELQTRREFAAGVTRGKRELKLKNPSNTPIRILIENAVIETYGKVSALHPYLTEHHLRFTIKIINVLYTYKKQYEPFFIYWLLPFQLSYNDEIDKDEEIYDIAMHLDLFIDYCFPKWSNVFLIADKIMRDLSINDQEFYEHLKTISKIRAKINPKEFFLQIQSSDNKSNENVTIFLRKWIGEMFVGILNSNSVLYLWDQFFLIKWNILYIEHAVKSILYLLHDRFMNATDYDEMRKVFLDEPCYLYTADIQAAFTHLALRNDDPQMIPNINRRFNPMILPKNEPNTNFESIGIRDISLSLVLPLNKDPRLEFKYIKLIVEIQVYANGEKLGEISTKSLPIAQRKEPPVYNWQQLNVNIPNDKLILTFKKVQQTNIPNGIQALIIVHQRLDVVTLKTLCYCRFPLYIPQKIANLNTWDVTYGSIKRTLHPGIPPASIDTIPDIPKVLASDKIGPGSTISLVIFDPESDQYLNPM